MDSIKRSRAVEILQRVGDFEPWQDLLFEGVVGDSPSLFLEDFSGIPFLDKVKGVEWYQLRSRTRAGDGDLFVATQKPVAGYEEYNQKNLGLGSPEFLHADVPGAHPLCVAETCLEDPSVMARIKEKAEEAGRLVLQPYMGSDSVWKFARVLQDQTEADIRVISPIPPAGYAANHKGILTSVIEILLGEGAVCRTVTSTDHKELAGAAREFAKDSSTLVLKIANYASAMGNEVFDSKDLASGAEEKILAFEKAHGWNGKMEILLSEWREDVLHSPSTQLWIPPSGQGDPRVDGVFEQLLEGRECVFQGSMPSNLPQELQDEMGRMSLVLADVFQKVGYVGRCSFDFILCGKDLSDAVPKFVECNGRWGGTSIPMVLMDRIFGKGNVSSYRARDYIDPALEGMPFTELCERLGDSLFDRRTGTGHYILYNVGCLRDFGKFDVIAMGNDREEASVRLEEEFSKRLLG
ncbi:MAG: hypothetical protein QF645_02575 [Planctomycetota bacterium]|nr:hypothetical protein [Planctomycetota bacterium]